MNDSHFMMSHLLPDCGSQCERIPEPTDVQEGLIAAEGLHHRRVLQQYAVHTLAGVLVLIKLHRILCVSALPGIRPNAGLKPIDINSRPVFRQKQFVYIRR